MRLPFGMHLPSLIVGALIVWFVIPWVMQFMNRNGSATTKSTA